MSTFSALGESSPQAGGRGGGCPDDRRAVRGHRKGGLSALRDEGRTDRIVAAGRRREPPGGRPGRGRTLPARPRGAVTCPGLLHGRGTAVGVTPGLPVHRLRRRAVPAASIPHGRSSGSTRPVQPADWPARAPGPSARARPGPGPQSPSAGRRADRRRNESTDQAGDHLTGGGPPDEKCRKSPEGSTTPSSPCSTRPQKPPVDGPAPFFSAHRPPERPAGGRRSFSTRLQRG